MRYVMKVLILYKTRKGSTKDYADYLYCKLENAEIYDIDEFNPDFIESFDKIIIGSATYEGIIIGKVFLEKYWGRLQKKPVFFFSVGMMDPESEASRVSYEMIPEYIRKKISYIKVPGRLQEDRLNFLQKLMVKMVKAPLVDKVDMTKLEPALKFARE